MILRFDNKIYHILPDILLPMNNKITFKFVFFLFYKIYSKQSCLIEGTTIMMYVIKQMKLNL